MSIIIRNLSDLPDAARQLLSTYADGRIFAFHGAMGAGKTTIIKALCEELGAADLVSSPTFTLVNEYITKNGAMIYHIDFYRIKKPEEIFDIGIEEYFSGTSYCFLEWPELAGRYLPESTVMLKINVADNGSRMIEEM